MIVTILPASNDFHAIGYNQHKAAKGEARIMEMQNIDCIDADTPSGIEQLKDYFTQYSNRNARIRQPQLHVAVSCKGREMTHAQLVEFAHKWLDKMGYGDPGQPLIVYAHNDTDNNHIHIITSRVHPSGRKIDHHRERVRSQQAIREILGHDLTREANEAIAGVKEFDICSEAQFRAYFQALNYQCFKNGDKWKIKKGGVVAGEITAGEVSELIESSQSKQEPDPQDMKTLRSWLYRYRDSNTGISGLKADLRRKFGIELVFFGKKDTPTGYAVVDFNRKRVMDGHSVLGIRSLLNFKSEEEHRQAIESGLDAAFRENPDITSLELCRRLRPLHARIRKGKLVFRNTEKPLPELMAGALRKNDKAAWAAGFKPASQEEKEVLETLFSVKIPDSAIVTQEEKYNPEADWSHLRSILGIGDKDERKAAMAEAGIKTVVRDNSRYAVDMKNRTVIDLDKAGLPKNETPRKNMEATQETPTRHHQGGPAQRKAMPGRGENREWEVGSKGSQEDIDDGRQFRY